MPCTVRDKVPLQPRLLTNNELCPLAFCCFLCVQVCADTTASFDLVYSPISWSPASKTPTAAGEQPGYCSRVPDFKASKFAMLLTLKASEVSI